MVRSRYRLLVQVSLRQSVQSCCRLSVRAGYRRSVRGSQSGHSQRQCRQSSHRPAPRSNMRGARFAPTCQRVLAPTSSEPLHQRARRSSTRRARVAPTSRKFLAPTCVRPFAPTRVRSLAPTSSEPLHLLSALRQRHVIPPLVADVHLLWPRDLLIGVEQHLFPLRDPARRSRNRK